MVDVIRHRVARRCASEGERSVDVGSGLRCGFVHQCVIVGNVKVHGDSVANYGAKELECVFLHHDLVLAKDERVEKRRQADLLLLR